MNRDDNTTDEYQDGQVATRRIAPPSLLGAGRKLRDGRYVLEEPLGYGGMAAVWKAHDERLGRTVAIKVLSDTLAHDEEYLTRFRREARVAARLTHPNLVTIYDYEASERPFLVMECIAGGNLDERIEAGEELPEPERLARELLAALRHIHAADVLHRDVKPQNVLIGVDGRARLTDFGIAQPRDATSLTRTGHLVGTERYLAPEVLAGEPASERSDLYGLGVVLAEAARAAGSTPAVDELVERLTAELPEDRPHSATAALAALERAGGPPATGEPTERIAVVPPVFGGDPTPPTQRVPAGEGDGHAPPPWEREAEPAEPWRPERADDARRRRIVAALALALVAVALIVGLAIGSGGDEDPADGGGGLELGAPADEGGDSGEGKTEEKPPAEEPAEPTTDPYALNDEGKALIDAGRPEEAIPLLEESVAGLEGCECEYYAFALYNLGNALRLAGRPDEAIPILEQRLEIPNQTEVVEAELALAREEAGVTTSDGGVEASESDGGVSAGKPGKGPKPGRGSEEGED